MSNSLRVSAWNACVSSCPSETTEEEETEARADVVIPLRDDDDDDDDEGEGEGEGDNEYELDPCDERRREAACGSR